MNDDENQGYEQEGLETQTDAQDDVTNVISKVGFFHGKNKNKVKWKIVRALGKALHLAGVIVETTGKAVQFAGKKVKQFGVMTYNAGRRIWDAGKALISGGYTAPIGIPLCILGAITMALGKITEGIGWLIIQLGKLIERLGKAIKKIASKIIEKANQKIKEAGGNAIPIPSPGSLSDSEGGLSTGGIPSLGGVIAAHKAKVIVIILIILCAISLGLYALLDDEKTTNDGSYVEGDSRNMPYVVSTTIMDNLVIATDGTGSYTYGFKNEEGEVVDLDQAIDSVIKSLKNNESDALKYISNDYNIQKKVIKKMIMAEIATQYPDLTDSKDLGLTTSEIDGGSINTTDRDYCVDMSNLKALPKCNETQLKQIINNTDINQEGKDNMLSVVSDLVKYQEKYKVNAVFFMAVVMTESSWGTNWDYIDSSTYNWTSVKGSNNGGYIDRNGTSWNVYSSFSDAAEAWFELISSSTYFGAKKNTVYKIGVTYCDANWANRVCEKIETYYNSINVAVTSTGVNKSNGTKTGAEKISDALNLENKINGGVKVQRKLEDGTVIDLKYTSSENFQALISANSSDVINYYTLEKAAKIAQNKSATADFSGSNNAEIIWNFLTSQGLSETCTAAIIGNLIQESGLDTGIEETTDRVDKGYGLAQWTFGRRTQLFTYAQVMNKEASDIELQLDFLWLEIDPTAEHTYANLQWGSETYGWSDQEGLYNEFISMNDINDATAFFCWAHERPNADYANLAGRQAAANEIYELYAGKTKSSDNSTKSEKKENSDNTKKSENSTSSSTSTEYSFDDFLFIGDSRYDVISNELKELGNNVTVCVAKDSVPSDWLDVAINGTGTVKGTTQTLPEKVRNISIMLGVNDTAEAAQTEHVLSVLHKKYETATIYVNSVYHVGSNYNGTVTNSAIDSYNDEIRNFCNQNSWAQYIDVADGLTDDSGNLKSEYANNDGFNITSDTGKKAFINNLKNAMNISPSKDKTATSSVATSSTPGYSIVVANQTSTTTNVVENYTYTGTNYTDIGHNSYTDNSRRWSNPSSGSKINNITSNFSTTAVAYQEALKNYTLYFNFLWAILVNTENEKLVEGLADLVCDNVGEKSSVVVTVFSETKTTSNQDTSTRSDSMISRNDSVVVTDFYNVTQTTTTTISTITSKLAVTYADTWLMKYENDADSYEEYTSKSKEEITEKIDKSSIGDNAITILKKNAISLQTMIREKSQIHRMLESSDKVAFMTDIFDYIIDIASKNKESEKKLSDLLDTSSFNLATFKPTSSGSGTSSGSLSGGTTQDEAGGGYRTKFTTGDRTFIEYKQGYDNTAPWGNTYVNGWSAGSNMGNSGCALTAIALIATGYGVDVTPQDVADLINSGAYGWGDLLGLSQHYTGKSCQWQNGGNLEETILNQLKAGKPCMVHTYVNHPAGHFLTVLAYNEDTNEVYVSDVGGWYDNDSSRNGWQPVSKLSEYDQCMIIGD